MRIKNPSLDWYFKWRWWTWCIYNTLVRHELFLHCWSSAETQNCWVPLDHQSSASIKATAASSSAPPEISYACFCYGPGDSRLSSWLVRSFLLYSPCNNWILNTLTLYCTLQHHQFATWDFNSMQMQLQWSTRYLVSFQIVFGFFP